MKRLAGKVIIVTGASRGIGAATAVACAKSSATVVLAARDGARAAAVAQSIGEAASARACDVTDYAAVEKLVEETRARFGRLDALINNAGIAVPGPLLHLGIDDFARQLAVNLTGPLIVTQAFAPLLGADRSRAGPPGRIVMMSSVGGLDAAPFVGAYGASKFGLEGLSESLRRELMLYGIDVVIINPGAVATPIWGKSARVDSDFAGTDYASAIAKVKAYMRDMAKTGLPPERIG